MMRIDRNLFSGKIDLFLSDEESTRPGRGTYIRGWGEVFEWVRVVDIFGDGEEFLRCRKEQGTHYDIYENGQIITISRESTVKSDF